MKQGVRTGLLIVFGAVCLFAGWRVLGQMQAERLLATAPAQALQWRENDPAVLQAMIDQAVQKNDPVTASALTRRMLSHEPLMGQGFRSLAQIADLRGDAAQAHVLFQIAERREPRDLPTRAWLAQSALHQHDDAAAMRQFDLILKQSPERFTELGPVLVQMAQDPQFARALANSLGTNPPWRAGMLQALQKSELAQARVMQALQAVHGLSAAEFGQWLDSLMAQGRWGEAFALWAGVADTKSGALPLLYNGDFRHPLSNAGFDWHQGDVPGVLLTLEPSKSKMHVAHLHFLGRGAAEAGLEHPLMLMPGRYRLGMQLRAQGFESELGLQWVVECQRGPRIVTVALPSDGSFDWRHEAAEFEIPGHDCQGQRLRLLNPVGGGGGQRVSGDLWLGQLQIERLSK